MSFKYIVVPFFVAVISQCIKIFIEYFKYKRFSFKRFICGMGGMPSTHSALVSSLSTIIYYNFGITPLFASVLVFSFLIIYDSMGIRYESGKQAEVINKLSGSNLNERIGHRPIEVLVGTFFGIVMTIIIELI